MADFTWTQEGYLVCFEKQTWEVENPRETVLKMILKQLHGRRCPSGYSARQWLQHVVAVVHWELQKRCERKYGEPDYLSRIGQKGFTLGYVRQVVRFRIRDLFRDECKRNDRTKLFGEFSTSHNGEAGFHDLVCHSPCPTRLDDLFAELTRAETFIATSNHKHAAFWNRVLQCIRELVELHVGATPRGPIVVTQVELARCVRVSRATLQRRLRLLREFLGKPERSATLDRGVMIPPRRWKERQEAKRRAVRAQVRQLPVPAHTIGATEKLRQCSSIIEAVSALLDSSLVTPSPGAVVRIKDVVRLIYESCPYISGDPRMVSTFLRDNVACNPSGLGLQVGYVDSLGAECVGNIAVRGCRQWEFRGVRRPVVIEEDGWLEPSPTPDASYRMKVA